MSAENEVVLDLEAVEREDGIAIVMFDEDGVSPVDFYTWAEVDALSCCDLHNEHCEPPSELCCWKCSEVDHPQHPEDVRCVLDGTRTGP